MDKKNLSKALALICSAAMAVSGLPTAAETNAGTNIEDYEKYAENVISDETDITDDTKDNTEADGNNGFSTEDKIIPMSNVSSVDKKPNVTSIPAAAAIGEDAEIFEETPVFPLTIPEQKDPWKDNIMATCGDFIVYANTDGSLSYLAFKRLYLKDENGNEVKDENNNRMDVITGDGNDYFRVSDFNKAFTKDIVQVAISSGDSNRYIAGLLSDGTVKIIQPKNGSPSDIDDIITDNWKNGDIVQISATPKYIAALKKDGTVIFSDIFPGNGKSDLNNDDTITEISSWTDIVKISAAENHLAALTKDGRVLTAGKITTGRPTDKNPEEESASWTDIVDITTTKICTIGITKDGKVRMTSTTEPIGNGVKEGNALGEWDNIQKIAAYNKDTKAFMIGLKKDGTAVISESGTPFNEETELPNYINEVSKWDNLVNVYVGDDYVVGEKKDGSYVYYSKDNDTMNIYLKRLNDTAADKDKISEPVISYNYEKLGDADHDSCYMNFTNPYTDTESSKYTLKFTDEYTVNENGEDISTYSDVKFDENGNALIGETGERVKITAEKDYYVRIYKNDIPARFIKVLSARKDDFAAEIYVDGANSNVAQEDEKETEFSFKAVYNGKETDAYDLKYVDNYKGLISPYDANTPIRTSVSSSYDLYGELKDSTGEEKIKTEIVNRKYYHFNSPSEYSCYYPEPCYPMTESDYRKLQSGNLMTRSNIIKTAAGSRMTLLLKTNGTVQGAYNSDGDTYGKKAIQGNGSFIKAAPGTNNSVSETGKATKELNDDDYKCVGNWRMISDIAVGNDHVLGLRKNGTVVATGSNNNKQCDVSEWNDIVSVAAGSFHSVGLKSDGTVVAVGLNGSNQCEVSEWNNIYSIAARNNYTVGLRNDGQILFAGDTSQGQDGVSGWGSDIIDISAGTNTVMGLNKYGKVVFAGANASELNEKAKDWKNIVSIEAGANLFIAIDVDGYIYYAYPKSFCEDDDVLGAVYYSTGEKWRNMLGTERDNWYKSENRRPIFDYLNYLGSVDKDGNISKIKYISAAVGEYSMILVTDTGRTINAIFDNPETTNGDVLSDDKYPMIANNYAINGPTIINNYISGGYNYDNLKIRLENTTSKGFEWYYTTMIGTEPETQGKKYNDGTIKMSDANNDCILKVLPKAADDSQNIYQRVVYYYKFENPELNAKAKPRKVDDKIVMDVSLSSTITGYDDIYYIISTPEPTNTPSPTPTPAPGTTPAPTASPVQNTPKPITSKPNKNNAVHYDKSITIDTPAIISAIAYNDNSKESQVATFNFSIPAEIDEHATYIEDLEIEKDTVWKKENSPYYLQNDLRINTGATLTVEPGVEVKCGKDIKITVNGSLNAVGTSEAPISFKNYTTDNWAGIDFVTGINDVDKNNAFSYVNITGANDGLYISTPTSTFKNAVSDENDTYAEISNLNIENSVTAMTINSASYRIKDSVFNHNKTALSVTVNGKNAQADNCKFNYNETGININGENASVTNSEIIQNSEVGVQTNSVYLCSVTDSEIYNNLVNVRTGTVAKPDSTVMDFTNNYWFNFTETFIRKTIKDYNNDKTLSQVDISYYDTSRKADYEKIEMTLPKNQNNLIFSPDTAKDTTRITFEVSSSYTPDTDIIIALYDKNGALVGSYMGRTDADLIVNVDTVGADGKPDAILTSGKIASIKVFAWNTQTMIPVLNPITIK